ncbi:MAG: hypothetical protein ABSF08_05665 [Candidatus Cybelea sp.]|jgi:hypothetical protein
MTRSRFALTLPGKPRNQEASRKRLVAELERTEKYCLDKAQKVSKARAMLAGCDVETIAQNNKATRAILTTLIQINDRHIRTRIGNLIGLETYGLDDEKLRLELLHRLHGCEDDTGSEDRGAPVQLAQRDGPPALANDTEEIDWRSEPRSECERAVRAAFIEQIEARGSSSTIMGAWWIKSKLQHLVDYREREAASDLAAKIAYWKRTGDEESVSRTRNENRRLLDRARLDVAAAGVPKELPANVVRFTPRAVVES